jgi:hypothetical protein
MKYTSDILDESEQADYDAFMQRVVFVLSGTRVQALIDGEPFTSFNDGDYWDAEGFHEGSNTVYTVNFESEAIARNFFAAYLIGLASTQEAESWKPVHLASEQERKEMLG